MLITILIMLRESPLRDKSWNKQIMFNRIELWHSNIQLTLWDDMWLMKWLFSPARICNWNEHKIQQTLRMSVLQFTADFPQICSKTCLIMSSKHTFNQSPLLFMCIKHEHSYRTKSLYMCRFKTRIFCTNSGSFLLKKQNKNPTTPQR